MTKRILVSEPVNRLDFWINFIREHKIETMVEVGVWAGTFAARILKNCDSIKKYYMIDPWRHIPGWNKPSNIDNDRFTELLKIATEATNFAADKRIILRGTTTEVMHEIPEDTLDFAYIDGDHTLKGITIDLISAYEVVNSDGWIGGDDFSKTIWQHQKNFEPTFIFPFAVYFAEAVNESIYALPHDQFLIDIDPIQSFSFTDFTGEYKDTSIRNQILGDNNES